MVYAKRDETRAPASHAACVGPSQLLMRLEVQRIKDARIEQLGMEKERLDYERAFALKQSRTHDGNGEDPEPADSVGGVDRR